MKDINKMRRERAAKTDEARSLVETAEKEERDLTEDEQTTFRSLLAEVDSRAEEIERYERLQALDAEKKEYEPGNVDGEFRSLGEFIHSVRFRPSDGRLRQQEMGDDDTGGYLVPPTYMTQLMTVSAQEARIRPRATVIPGNAANPDAPVYMPAVDYTAGRYGGVAVDWIDEGAEKPETEATFRQITLQPHEVAAHIEVTDKLLQNYSAAETLFSGLLRSAIIAAEDQAFLTGAGAAAGEPTGILGHASVVEVPRDTAGEIAYEDIVTMYSSILFGGSLVWLASPTTLPQLMNLVDGAGQLIWQPNAREGAPGSLVGIPVVLNERSPVLGVEGDLLLADLKYYLILDGFGLAVAASPHVLFRENRTIIKAFKRVDGAPWLNAPLELEDGATEVSPFVVLTDAGT